MKNNDHDDQHDISYTKVYRAYASICLKDRVTGIENNFDDCTSCFATHNVTIPEEVTRLLRYGSRTCRERCALLC